MKQTLVVTSDDTGSREDFNAFYCGYLLVSHETMSFDKSDFDGKFTQEGLVAELRRLGYTVVEPEVDIVTTDQYADEEE